MPPGYSFCARENGSCNFDGWKLIAFGNQDKFVSRWFLNGAPCNNGAFGADPDLGVVKACSESAAWGTSPPSGYAACASEGGTCAFSGTQLVGFGYEGYYVYKLISNNAPCAVGSFGVDPASGFVKDCIVPADVLVSETINDKLGAPARVLIGLGTGNTISAMKGQSIEPDIIDTYLGGVGSSSWIAWNSPSGAYLTIAADAADAYGAIPMFTLYQMAQNGDGNISGIADGSFMNSYWAQVRLMFQLLGSYGKPALVNLEPDFWGYAEWQSPNDDPTQLHAVVSTQPECSSSPNSVAGIAQCMSKMARTYAPKTLIGFPASFFGETAPQLAAYMRKAGAQNADFIVAQTYDRDAGCMELPSPPSQCAGRGAGPFYWDENNVQTPDFLQSQQRWTTYKNDLGNDLPVLWWQTPMGAPSDTPGGYEGHYRDNHVDYMLQNVWQYAAMHSFALVFSSGATGQATIATDGGEFMTLWSDYVRAGGNPVR